MERIILTDSCCDLPISYINNKKLAVINFSYTFKGKTYEDDFGYTVSHKDFYNAMRAGEMPTTAQINTYRYESLFRSFLEKCDEIIYICFSSALSGSFMSANSAKRNLLEEYPEASIEIIDSRCASLGEGLLCRYVLELAEGGASSSEIVEWAERNKTRINHFFTVKDLDHLKRGGRISGTAAAIGTMLNINPMLTVCKGGGLKVIDKIRGRKKSLAALAELFVERAEEPENQTIAICHGDCEEDARYVEELIRKHCNVREVIINSMGPIIGTHTGPGVVALFFMGKERD
ncbi:MAG: DegV family protein [Clostridiaceae bacterium]|jgi:DegV family protein with EDD domain|nr:DegV family protein [Clostridiaceae bacterium]